MGMLGWLWPTLIIIGLIVLAIGVIALSRRRGVASSGPTARELLDQRYARGEIDDAEYQRRRDQLS
ncbi:SHOCT domain-containing protein [Actinomycetospora rhizophila]|uniref:SHOCT domain-containing protein n=1 Tax=Actinomycetospora rhizophila TaxID=1416876 RepID=A0ABV9ZK59_9PSEU